MARPAGQMMKIVSFECPILNVRECRSTSGSRTTAVLAGFPAKNRALTDSRRRPNSLSVIFRGHPCAR